MPPKVGSYYIKKQLQMFLSLYKKNKNKITSCYATFQCSRYNVFKKKSTFFAPEKMKKTTHSIVTHNLPRPFFQ